MNNEKERTTLVSELSISFEVLDCSEDFPQYSFYYSIGTHGSLSIDNEGKYHPSFDGTFGHDFESIDILEFFEKENEKLEEWTKELKG